MTRTAAASGIAWTSVANTLYSGNGTLAGNRQVTMGANNLSFTGTGRVGIGTTTPDEKLDVEGGSIVVTTPGQYLKFPHPSGADGNDGKIGAGMFGSGLNIVGIGPTVPSRKIRFFGNVGINMDPDSNPRYSLQVNGAVSSTVEIRPTLSYPGTYINVESGNTLQLYTIYELRARFNNSNGGSNMLYDGDNNIDYLSDRRIKKDIRKLDNSFLEHINSINIVDYRYKKDTINKYDKEVGVIAQDLEEHYPFLVTDSKEVDPEYGIKIKTVAYSHLGLVAIKAIQELKAVVDHSKEEIKTLKAEVEVLKAKMESIEAQN